MKKYLHQLDYRDYGIAAVSLLAVVVCLTNGLTHTYDSQLYLTGSKFIEQNGFENLFSCGTFNAKPPLYPLLVYLWGNNEVLISISHLAFHAISLFLAFLLINRLIATQPFQLFTKIVVGLSTPLIMVQDFLLPESVFMMLWVWQLFLLPILWHQPSRKMFSVLMFSSILMILLRHIGIVPVVISGLFTWVWFKNTSNKSMAILNLILPVGIFAGWQMALYLHMGHIKRLDHFSGLDVTGNIQEVLLQFSRWFVPGTQILYIDIALSCIAIGAIIYLTGLTLFQSKGNKLFWRFCTILSGMFIGFIILKGDLIHSDIERYLSIVYFPIFLLIIAGLEHFNQLYKVPQYLLRPALLVWFIYPVVRLLKNVVLWSGFHP